MAKKRECSYLDITKRMFTVGTVVVVWLTVVAFYYRQMTDDQFKSRVQNILSALLVIDQKYPIRSPRIAVGYGACQDIIVNASDIFECNDIVNDTNDKNDTGLKDINSFSDLHTLYSHFFKHGAAAERYINDANLFEELVERVKTAKSARFNIGGNAAIMARRFALQGFDVILAATTTSEFRKQFPANLKFIGNSVEKDDTHLVFEYDTGEKCGPFVAPRANRFIVHRDYYNTRISSLETFGQFLREFHPHLLIVSGLQMMDSDKLLPEYINERLMKINKQIISQAAFTKIHFEMASISNKHLFEQIFKVVIPHVDSIGTNEQELENVLTMLKYNRISSAVNSTPKRKETLDTMREIFRILLKTGHKLTRLHVHTLGYQVIMVKSSSNWKNLHAAVAKASLVANKHVCGTSEVELDKATVIMDNNFSISSVPGSRRIYIDDDKPVTCWDEDNFNVCIAPNIVCTKAIQTAGCGDNVSAAGLAAQF